MDPNSLVAGLQHHRAGEFAQAEVIYRQLLADNPQDASVYNLLGALCIDAGRANEAETYLRQALALDPLLAAAHDNLGLLSLSRGQSAEAVASFRRALALDGKNAQTHANLARALVQVDQPSEAIEAWEHAVRLAPENLAASAELGRLLYREGRHAEAAIAFRRVAQAAPQDVRAHFELAASLAAAGQYAAAIEAYLATLAIKPDVAEACANLAVLYLEQGRDDESERWARRAVELRPEFADAHQTLGFALIRRRRYDAAIDALHTALRLNPQLIAARHNLGVALLEVGRFTEAVEHCRAAALATPTNPQALYNLGGALLKSGDVSNAIEQFDRAIELSPDYAEARFSRSAAWLLEGRLAEGLAEYEWRLRLRDFPTAPLPWPDWNGESLTGRSIVLASEQGVGDTFQCVRYAALLKARGARVIVQADRALHPILSRTPGIDALVPLDAEVDADFGARMMGLPHRLQTTLDTIPAQVPYIFADPGLVAKWRERMSRWDGVRVGIAWQGNPRVPSDRQRSIPLAQFAPLARVPGVRLFSLQKGPGVDQLGPFATSWPVIDFGDEVDTSAGAFMDTAAIMSNLDLVITSDTAIPHLAGALGMRVWVALQRLPDWRFMLDREDIPWYPTMRLFRQPRSGDWESVFARVADELERVMAESC